jgi:TonB-linked SusC/RagA family outer membrane protein
MSASSALPWIPLFHPTAVDASGNPLLFDPLSGRNLRASLNRDNYINDVESFRSISVAFAEWSLPWVEGLSVRSELGYDYVYTSNIEWANTVLREGSSYAFDFSNNRNRLNYNIYGTYNKQFAENHNINVVAGFERTSQTSRSRNTEADQLIGTAKEIGTPGNVQRVSNGLGGEIYFQGLFARLNYKFMDRYLLGLSYRYDGSSIFAEDSRFGSFPAVSAGWIISDESFMSNVPALNFLKLRASIGQQGNSAIDPNATLTTYATWGRYGDVGAGDLLNTIGNQDVTWETQTATDVAVDFELLESRISGSVGYYNQKVEDMLYRVPIAQSSGIFGNGPTIWNNIGDMRNYGMEFQVNATVVNSGDFRWSVGFNITTNQNEVLALSNEDDELYVVNNNALVTKVGESIGFFRLARYAGIHAQGGYELIEEMDLDVFSETGERVATGNLIPATRTNLQTHLFDNTDKANLPTYFGGFNTSVAWKGIDFSMNFSYQGGNYIFDNAEYSNTLIGTATDVLRSDLVGNTWTESNTDADWPMLVWNRRYDVINEDGTISANQRFDNQRNGQRHDKFLKKGDFIRLRSLVLGYSIPTSAVEKIGLSKIRIYGMANNLLTITGYDGYDPEVVSLGGSQSRNTEQGWVGTQLPQLRSFSLGINVGF